MYTTEIDAGALAVAFVLSLLTVVGVLYAATTIAGIGPVSLQLLFLAAVVTAGIGLVGAAVIAGSPPGIQPFTFLAVHAAHVWALKALLATSWVTALVIWVVSIVISVALNGVLAAIVGSAAPSVAGPTGTADVGPHVPLTEEQVRRLLDD